MSLYNLLFKNNPMAPLYLHILGLRPDEVGRFRDCFLKRADDGTVHIALLTRNGGGNRPDYEAVTDKLRAHPEYVGDYDDDFDCTYATYEFRTPERWKPVVEKAAEVVPNQLVDPMQRFQQLLGKMERGETDDPEVKQAMEAGRPLIAQLQQMITDTLEEEKREGQPS